MAPMTETSGGAEKHQLLITSRHVSSSTNHLTSEAIFSFIHHQPFRTVFYKKKHV